MLEKIIALDKKLFIFLNGLGSQSFDGLWLLLTKQFNWIPLFLVLLYFILKKLGTKQTLVLLLFIAVLITFTDQMTNVFKNYFQRLRPCNDTEINGFIRIVKGSYSYSFFSGHASNTMAVATFLYLLFKKHYKYFYLLFLWPIVFGYSRIYLGLHFPIDILAGYIFGMICGFLFLKFYEYTSNRYLNKNYNYENL